MRALLAALLLVLVAPSLALAGPTARVAEGVAEGVALPGGVAVFHSLPYAAPPTGPLRWRAPRPAPPWSGVRSAKAFGPSCTQNISAKGWGPWTGEFSPQGAVSEDCLTLTVWTPAHRPGERLPVMLWIPGGGLTDGGEAALVTNAAALAARGVVVVSINYRVAAFGLLAHPATPGEADGTRGNQAVKDALAALTWVHANAEAFGGDPGRITLAGQSAGGALSYILLAHPAAKGLIAGAIIQSFPPGAERLPDAMTMRDASVAFGEAMLAAPATTVLAASGDAGLNLFVDGVHIRDPGFAPITDIAPVPILIGVTADELSWLKPTLASHRESVAKHGPDFLRLYPAATDAQALDAALAADRDDNLVGLRRWRAARARAAGGPSFVYLWDHPLPGPRAALYRAFHSSEVPYMFGSLDLIPARPFTERDRAIAGRMMDYWANFVKTGDPNGAGLAVWPREGVMRLGKAFEPLPEPPADVIALFNAYDDRTGRFSF